MILHFIAVMFIAFLIVSLLFIDSEVTEWLWPIVIYIIIMAASGCGYFFVYTVWQTISEM